MPIEIDPSLANKLSKVVKAIFADERVDVRQVRMSRRGRVIVDLTTERGDATVSTPFTQFACGASTV